MIVDEFDAALELMSGLLGGDDGDLSEADVATLYEAGPYSFPVLHFSDLT